MPTPINPNESIYVEHKILDGSYSMPSMQAASDHYMIGYLVSGDRKWFSYERIGIAHAGDVGICKAGTYHRNCALSDRPYDRYLIKFKPEALQPVIALIGQANFDLLCTDYMHFTAEMQTEIHNQFEEMLQEYNRRTPYTQLILTGMLQRLFFTVYREHLPMQQDTRYCNKFDSRIHDALIYMEDHLENNPSVNELANYTALSPSHFSRLFRDVTGCSYTEYLTDIKLQRAQILLGNTNLSIGQIAQKTGFSNANYLSTVFCKKFECSPSGYRKKWQSDEHSNIF